MRRRAFDRAAFAAAAPGGTGKPGAAPRVREVGLVRRDQPLALKDEPLS